MTSGLETEWDDSGRKRRDGQKKKIGKANEKWKQSKKEQKMSEWTREELRWKGGTQAPCGVNNFF